MPTLEQIQEKIAKLQVQAEHLFVKKSQAALEQIRALMRDHGLTSKDIEHGNTATRSGLTSKQRTLSALASESAVKAKALPKYQHPKTGATWTGHGRAPSWIVEARDRNKFLLPTEAATEDAGEPGKADKGKSKAKERSNAPKSAKKGSRLKGPQPPMYRDPLSGATWSGRGRAPAWLGSDRTSFLIGTEADAATQVNDKSAISTKGAIAIKKTKSRLPAAEQ
jgi:DNA-binding protein H-NS